MSKIVKYNVIEEHLIGMVMSEEDFKECEPFSYDELYSLFIYLNDYKEEIKMLDERVESLAETNATQADIIRESIFKNKPCEPAIIHELKSTGTIQKLEEELTELKKQNKALTEQVTELIETQSVMFEKLNDK